jgi:hypothetical protein
MDRQKIVGPRRHRGQSQADNRGQLIPPALALEPPVVDGISSDPIATERRRDNDRTFVRNDQRRNIKRPRSPNKRGRRRYQHFESVSRADTRCCVFVCKQSHSAIGRFGLLGHSRAADPCSRKNGRPPASSWGGGVFWTMPLKSSPLFVTTSAHPLVEGPVRRGSFEGPSTYNSNQIGVPDAYSLRMLEARNRRVF